MSSSSIIKRHSLFQRKTVVDLERGVGGYAGAIRCGERNWDPAPLGVGSATLVMGDPGTSGTTHPGYEALENARVEAEAIIEQAKAVSDGIREQAYREGHQEGHQAGYTEGLGAARSKTAISTRRLIDLAGNATVDMNCILKNSEEAVVGLALAIAERVVYTRLSEDRSLVLAMVRGALERADSLDVIRVRVNPDDIEILRTHWNDGQLGNAGKNIELTSDPSVQLGGCIVDAKSAVLDAQIDTKFAEIDKAFRTALDSSTR